MKQSVQVTATIQQNETVEVEFPAYRKYDHELDEMVSIAYSRHNADGQTWTVIGRWRHHNFQFEVEHSAGGKPFNGHEHKEFVLGTWCPRCCQDHASTRAEFEEILSKAWKVLDGAAS